ncbi:hypothetical protein AGMMS49953_02630 [Endomicrobiia bacterium]|uniref:HAD family hydrolase n=1 Tax=Endomicrobium trichonymphae TaxID=1408204 RepID=UPI0011EA6A61|nr:hypothetical protein [Candidatus Endomicrobium trichonymphae]GHT22936.1 hypothetical protein AGMMS49953_02630 [Endomicrobiia bacterium]
MCSYLGTGVNGLMSRAVPIVQAEVLEKFNFYYRWCLTDTTVIYNGIREMLEVLKNKKKAILSNKNEHFSYEIVKRLGWEFLIILSKY